MAKIASSAHHIFHQNSLQNRYLSLCTRKTFTSSKSITILQYEHPGFHSAARGIIIIIRNNIFPNRQYLSTSTLPSKARL